MRGLVCFLFSVVFLLAIVPGALAGWNDSWSCSIPINISVSSGTTQQNYQVLLNISYDAYNCSGEMQADFDDLRFVDGDHNSELDYWIESKVDSVYAKVWVEIDQNITTTNYTIYMYYGNSTVGTASDGTNTFDYYHGVCTDCYFASPGNYGDNYGMRAKVYEDAHNKWWGFTDIGTDPRQIIYYDITECPAVGSNLCYYSETTGHETLGGDFADQLHIFEIIRNGTTNILTKVDDANLQTHAYQSQTTKASAGKLAYEITQIDWFFIRKWYYPEPTYSIGLKAPPTLPTLEERVEQLEQQVINLTNENLLQQQQISNLTQENQFLKQQIQNNTQRIGALEILVSGLQAAISTIQETLDNIVDGITQTIANYLSNLPKGLRQQMICGALEQTNITNSTGFGLYCGITDRGCKCQEL